MRCSEESVGEIETGKLLGGKYGNMVAGVSFGGPVGGSRRSFVIVYVFHFNGREFILPRVV